MSVTVQNLLTIDQTIAYIWRYFDVFKIAAGDIGQAVAVIWRFFHFYRAPRDTAMLAGSWES